jgi:hypothetical protein
MLKNPMTDQFMCLKRNKKYFNLKVKYQKLKIFSHIGNSNHNVFELIHI